MRMMLVACTLLTISPLAGCGPSTREHQPAKFDTPSQDAQVRQDLISADGELFPLSAYYGVCTKYVGIWRTALHSGPFNPHEPTGGEITVAGGIILKLSVGKFSMLPDAEFKDVPAVSLGKRLQVGRDRLGNYVLVSGFDGAGNNRVSIGYDKTDVDAQAAALRLANNVVACRVSAVPAKAKNG